MMLLEPISTKIGLAGRNYYEVSCQIKGVMKMKKCLMLIVSLLAMCVFSSCKNNTASDSDSYKNYEDLQSFETTEAELPQNLFYNEIGISTLLNDLQGNALKAKRTYLNERFLIRGVIVGSGSNSIGDFVRVGKDKDDWNYIVCYFKNDSQIDAIMDKKDGDPITIKGIVTDIDEISGYSMDIEDIYTVKAVGLTYLQNELGKADNPYLNQNIEIFGKLEEDGENNIKEDSRGTYIYIVPTVKFPGENIKIKCYLTIDEQIDLIKNAGGRKRITVQGKLTDAKQINIIEIQYITELKY